MPGLKLGLGLGLGANSSPGKGGYVPGLDLDFVQGRYALAGPYGSAFPTGWSFSRTGAGLAQRADGTFVSFASGVPRITDRGLLVEESRTNLIPSSNGFGGGGSNFAMVGAAPTPGVLAPDGSTTASTIAEDTATSNHGIERLISGTPTNKAHSISIFVKRRDFDWVMLIYNDGTTQHWANFNLATGVIGNTSGGAPTWSIQPASGGWFRIACTAITAPASNQILFRLRSQRTLGNAANPASTYAGDGASGLHVWGGQVEAGAFATSPIITTGAAATRGADVATVTGLSSILPAPFVLAADVDMPAIDGVSRTLALANDGSINNAIRLQRNLANDIRAQATIANITQPTSSISGYTGARAIKSAVRSRATELRGSFDGVLAGNLTGQSMPPGLNRLDVGSFVGSSFVNAYIRRVQIIPGDMTDAQLQALTS